MQFSNNQHFAQQLDEQDPLKHFRQEFIIPTRNGKEQIYFLGNSLGLQPKSTQSHIQQVLDQWSQWGVKGFTEGEQPWMQYHDQLTPAMSQIVGALPHEVVIMNQLTTNLHLLMVSFYQPTGKRNKIICEAKAFPSDQYMLETHVKQRGYNPEDVIIEVKPEPGEVTIRQEAIIKAIQQYGDEVALVLWGGVNYYTGQVFDMQAITKAAKEAGAMVGFDLAHAVGNIPLQLHDWNVDFAGWCNYKYINAGPGAVGGAYIHERYHRDNALQRFAGWWGYERSNQFKMQKGFIPIPTAEGWSLSTPSPVLYAAVKASLQVFAKADLPQLFQKGQWLSDYLLFLIHEINQKYQTPFIKVITPPDAKGCQISMLMLRNGKEIFNALSDEGVFADWREPDVIRVAPVPLYNTFEEVWRFGQIIEKACKQHS